VRHPRNEELTPLPGTSTPDAAVEAEIAGLDVAQIFDRLFIGPSPYSWAMHQAFEDALTHAGVDNAGARIVSSGIPIRA
jgi:2-keto-3-deoxy-6-phosphogluconate aldolase